MSSVSVRSVMAVDLHCVWAVLYFVDAKTSLSLKWLHGLVLQKSVTNEHEVSSSISSPFSKIN